MEQLTERSCAKLNLSLDVLARRDDGYHDLRMVMCSVELHDVVTVSLRTDGIATAESNFSWLPRDQRNLAVKAAQAFFDAVGEPNPGISIRIKKNIPVGAGMAGGSANAAAVLRALNTLTGAGLGTEALRRIALSVGSDVPYCVAGGMALAQGRGEELTPLPTLPDCHVVICKPAFSVSTAELFHRLDGLSLKAHPDTTGLIEALRAGNLSGVAVRMYNVFESALPRNCGEIFSIRSALLDHGALGAIMTGTGSAVFGVFAERDTARKAHAALAEGYRDCFLTTVCKEEFI